MDLLREILAVAALLVCLGTVVAGIVMGLTAPEDDGWPNWRQK